ncbi:glycoside hydrolase family 31 protein [Arcticibacter eurypsychrophilus]|uniref:glycoside hydrolase family 31 protein n=1 Tax=Arcticibacter eurypsychrophilus TaxID=1434752 RepID=UPI00084D73A5|nr:TIM-barrel domain-containing protein [Arcticibacter eurypsychrophilus]
MKIKRRSVVLIASFALLFKGAIGQDYKRTAAGIIANIDSFKVELQFFSPAIIRVLKYPTGSTYTKKSLSVIETPQNVLLKVHQSGSILSLTSSSVRSELNLKTGQVVFFSKNGKELVREKESGTQFTPVRDSEVQTYKVRQSFELDQDEAIYGMGQHQKGVMNYRNKSVKLKQSNMEIAIPFLHSIKGYGLFWDNYSTTNFDDNKEGASFESEIGDCADYYFIAGANADQVIAGLHHLTGKAPMFPRWAFGFWQSRERYKSQYQTVEVVKKYRELGIPLDGVVQDWQYWGIDESLWNSTEFGNPAFPDPKAMVDSIHGMNAHIIISVWPSFGNKTKIFHEMKEGNMLFDFVTWPINPNVQVYDAFNPKARKIYWKYLNKNIQSIGMDGWWLDATEPDQLKPKSTDDENKTWLGSFRKVRNAFPLQSTGGVYQNQRSVTSDKRVFILTRSAFVGQQRNATMTWSGDVQSTWDVLRNQISAGLNLSLSGIPYWNSDIGGFFPRGKYPKGVKDPAFHELYVRWMEFAAFTSMFRSHGEFTPREIYQFGKKGDWAFDAQEKIINLRYRFLPYIYSNAWAVTSGSSSMMRALFMDFPEDKKVVNIDNQYMFGKSLLVAPVTDSMYTKRVGGVTETDIKTIKLHKVYLPAGHDWYDFWTGNKISGGQEIERAVPIDLIPLYVKAGSIIPMGPFQQYSNEKDLKNLEIRLYPGADGSFTLYEDENDNYNYEKGMFSTITFKWNDKTRNLTVEDRIGTFSGMIQNRLFNVTLVNGKQGVGMAEPMKPTQVLSYSGKKKILKFE